ncbi:MAG: hypothetical protein JW741_16050 [Sedimentisphaerales bacterium]|nr:hypothetical protein [Sedimentisphaerales bacterium]
MLDKKLKSMLDAAATLTADDLDCLRGMAVLSCESEAVSAVDDEAEPAANAVGEAMVDEVVAGNAATAAAQADVGVAGPSEAPPSPSGIARGEYERARTRESKIATACVGQERAKHDWWPIGTELFGRIGAEGFTAIVVENPAVKSGRSLRITSGSAFGKICRTPTRAALEATESYRQANNLGRGGGVTNGWAFWKPRA